MWGRERNKFVAAYAKALNRLMSDTSATSKTAPREPISHPTYLACRSAEIKIPYCDACEILLLDGKKLSMK